MVASSKVLIDWTKPIEHVIAGTVVMYCGLQAHVEGEFKHLVVSGNDKAALFLDDYGCQSAKNAAGRLQRVRNVGTKPEPASVAATPGPNFEPLRVELEGARIEMLSLLGGLNDNCNELGELKAALIRATAAQVKLAEDTIRSVSTLNSAVIEHARSLVGAISELRKLAAEQQTAYMNANMLLLEELRREVPKPEPVQALPVPAPVIRPSPIPAPPEPKIKPTIVRDLKELSKVMGDAAEVKGREFLTGVYLEPAIETLALCSGVTQITIGYDPEPFRDRTKRGLIKYMQDIQGASGVRLRGFDENFSRTIFVYFRPEARDAVLATIQHLSQKPVAKVR